MGAGGLDELQTLWDLKRTGAITDQEYLRLKAEILERPAKASPSEQQRTSFVSKAKIHTGTKRHLIIPGRSVLPWLAALLTLFFSVMAAEHSVAATVLLILAAALTTPIFWYVARPTASRSARNICAISAAVAGLSFCASSPSWRAEMAKNEAQRNEAQQREAQAAESTSTDEANSSDNGVASEDAQPSIHYQTLSKQAVIDGLRDPDSAKFRDVAQFSPTIGGEKRFVYCGEVNAKNGFSGYAGFEPFIAFPTMAVTPENAQDFRSAWNKFCTGPGEKTYW
jgi:hypothetical protein